MTASPFSSPLAGGATPPFSASGSRAEEQKPRANNPLTGVGILVTRPREQAAALNDSLEKLGARPVLFPALAILPPSDPVPMQQAIARLDTFHLAIFISPTAAQRGLAAVGTWSSGLPVAAVGKGTAKALHELDMQAVLVPESGADSEHLLALPEFQDINGWNIVIFRGEGGREMLTDTLKARGAQITHAECYRRGLPQHADPGPILALFAAGSIQAVTAYSGETLDNLFQLLGEAGHDFLRRTPLFVPHPRIAARAKALGVDTVISSPPGETQLIPSLVEYFAHD
jgi:uroporphyrinogen-III synthase